MPDDQNGRRGEHRIRQVSVKGLVPAAILLHEADTRLGVRQDSIDDLIPDRLVEKISELPGEVVAAPFGSDRADPIENLPDGD